MKRFKWRPNHLEGYLLIKLSINDGKLKIVI